MEKIMINEWAFILLSIISLVMLVLIIILFWQKRQLKINSLENQKVITLLQTLAGNNQITPELIDQIPISYLAAFRNNIKNYYEYLIKERSFDQLANFIYELEHSISDFHKKRLLMELFLSAATRIDYLHWARLLMDSIPSTTMVYESGYQQKAKRFKEFIITNAKSNKSLHLLSGNFSNELIKNTNGLGISGIILAQELLGEIISIKK